MPNNVTFPFDSNDDRSLSLSIQSMVAQDSFNGSISLIDTRSAIYVTVDFTVPHLWLPISVCDMFASAFHLEYDNTTDLYLVNDTTRAELKEKNPTVTIGFGVSIDPAQRVNIVLPYSAFDLQASYPMYPNDTNYFPIRRAQNASMYTLGRAFMQEAYVRVDYERSSFSVHQTLFPATNEKQVIVPIHSVDSITSSQVAHRRALSPGAIAGIVVGIVSLLCLLVSLGFWLEKRKSQQKTVPQQQNEASPASHELANEKSWEMDGTENSSEIEIDGREVWELHDPSYLPVELNAQLRYELSGGDVSHVKKDGKSSKYM